LHQHWREVIGTFLKVGALNYGGAAVGIIQTEVQEKHAWVPKDQFLEGLALVNTLPGPSVIQMSIFLGYTRAGWWGGVLVGLCFLVPGFCILLALTLLYHHYGALPRIRHVFYGLSPVVVGIFAMSVYRLGRAAVRDGTHVLLTVASALAIGLTLLGIVPTLLLAGAAGVALLRLAHLGHRRSAGDPGAVRRHPVGECMVDHPCRHGHQCRRPRERPQPESLGDGALLPEGRCLDLWGGLTILAFIQEQVVHHLHWPTPQQFLDGLALGQLTPGPTLILAAFVGYAVGTLWGAVVALVRLSWPMPYWMAPIWVRQLFGTGKSVAQQV
jgi:chromate transporter